MIRTEKSHLKSIARSHAGMSGKNNEDRYGVSAHLMEDEASTPVLFSIMADGIGGHRAGEVAAEMVVDLVSQKVASSDGKKPLNTLKEAIQTASNKVFAMAQAESGRKGMGATVVCAWIIGKQLYTAYVGDSRIYLIREGHIFRLTRDHSWIQEAIDSGILTPEQAVGHPNAHVIRRYVGSPEPPEVDFRLQLHPNENEKQSIDNQGMMLQNGDKILLCSDGLTDLVEDEEILAMIQENTPEETVEKLIDLANQRGGHDNITTILVRVPEGVFVEKKPQPKPSSSPIPMRTLTIGCLGVATVVILAVAAFFGFRWLNQRNQVTTTPTVELVTTEQGLPLPTQDLVTKPAAPSPSKSSLINPTQQKNTLAPPENSGTSPEGNIPPPPDENSMTAAPTNTNTTTLTPTKTQTVTPTASRTP